VTVTGLISGMATSDNPLIPAADGRGDEIYAAAVVRRYDRRTSQAVESSSLQTFVYGDTFQAPDRQIAGSLSPLGGIVDSDRIPRDMSVARAAAPQEGIFPWRLWEGTLTNGADALIISPSIWESDNNPRLAAQWAANQNSLTGSLLTRQQVLNQINGSQFGSFYLDPVAGAPVNNLALDVVLSVVSGTLVLPLVVQQANVGFSPFDRPIGLVRNRPDSMALANPQVVLTREIIESALNSPFQTTIPTPQPGVVVIVPKPGIMLISFADGDMSNTGERQAAYYMTLQVEKLSDAASTAPATPATSSTAPTPGGGRAAAGGITAPRPTFAIPSLPTEPARGTTATADPAAPGGGRAAAAGGVTAPRPNFEIPTLPSATTNPTPAGALPEGASGVPDGVTAVPGAPPQQGIQDLIGSCTLRGPRITGAFASPVSARLYWEKLAGATSYRVLRSDLGAIHDGTTFPFFAQYIPLQPGATYVFIVMAIYPQGCGVTARNVIPSAPNPYLGVSTSASNSSSSTLTAGQVRIDVSVSSDIRGVHVEGPAIPAGGRDHGVVGNRPTDRGFDSSRDWFVLSGVPRGSQTWTATVYWESSAGRVYSAPVSVTANVP
jgi:hypothetical protein